MVLSVGRMATIINLKNGGAIFSKATPVL